MKQTNLKIILLSIFIMLISAHAYSFTVNGISYKIEQPMNVAVVIPSELGDGYSGAITIPSSVKYNAEEYQVYSIGEGAFKNCTNLTSVSSEGILDEIGKQAFLGCTNLSSITINCRTIGTNAFNSCTKLENINLGNSLRLIEAYAFFLCTSITAINLPKTVQYIGDYAFADCSNMKSIIFGTNVITIGNSAFAYCKNLTSIELPSSLTSIGQYAFSCCSKLTTVILFKPSMGLRVFNNCSELREIYCLSTPPKVDTNAFSGLNIETCKLYVKNEHLYEFYAAEVLQDFTNILVKSPICSTPKVSIIGNKIYAESTTPGAQYAVNIITTIGDDFFPVGVVELELENTKTYIMVSTFASGYDLAPSVMKEISKQKLQDFLFLKGDVNGDNEVNISDVTTLVDLITKKK